MAEGGVFIVADALIHPMPRGIIFRISGHVVGHRAYACNKNAGGAELIAVVVDEAGFDGGQIRDEQAGVEGEGQ